MRVPAYVWVIVFFVFASLGIVGAFVYQSHARKADAERRAAAVAEAERQTAQAAAEQREREERDRAEKQAVADATEKRKAREKESAIAAAKKAAADAQRRYDLMSADQRQIVDDYRKAIAARGDKAPEQFDFWHHQLGSSKWFLINNAEQFPGHDIVGAMCAAADRRGVDFLVKHQKPTGRAITLMKVAYFDLGADAEHIIRTILQIADAKGLNSLGEGQREYIRNHPALFPAWSK